MLKEIIKATRKNHALEHATINILTRQLKGISIAGLSGPSGFTLFTDLPLEAIVTAVQHARAELASGHLSLAYHERCGTNAVVTATLTTFATLLALGRRKNLKSVDLWLERVPFAVLLNAIVLIFAPRIASFVQRNVSTDAKIGDLKVTSVLENTSNNVRWIQVRTE